MTNSDILHRSQRWLWIVPSVIAGAVFVIASVWFLQREQRLPAGVSQHDYQQAQRRFIDLYGWQPKHLDVISMLGETAVAEGHLDEAVECFREIPTSDPRYGLTARLQEGQVLARLNRAREAEHSLRMFLAAAVGQPSIPKENLIAAHNWLGYLLSVQLRFEDRKQMLAQVHQLNLPDLADSKQYHFPHLLIWNSPAGRARLNDYLKLDPENRDLQIANGRYLTADGKLHEARRWLEGFHLRHPNDLKGAAALLECYYELDETNLFHELIQQLPDADPGEPWLLTRLRGESALRRKEWEFAVKYFRQLLEHDPTDPASHMGLARAYGALGRNEDRDQVQERSLVLARIRSHLVNVKEDDPAAILELAAACDEIGLESAAATFRRHAQRAQRTDPTR